MDRTTNSRGQFIVFEGLDGSGKSTQCKKLKEAIIQDGQLVERWTTPDRTTRTGCVIGAYLKEDFECNVRAIQLLFSANRWEKAVELEELLRSGTTVIMDRYAFSGIAYAVVAGLPLNWCKQLDAGLPKPDCVIFLQLSPEDCKKRAGFGKERYENVETQHKVLKQFQQIQDETWKVIDADQTIEEVHEEIYNHIKSLEKGPLQKLWSELYFV